MMAKPWRAFVGAFFLSGWLASTCAADPVLDLNGFRLWQYKGAAEKFFGKPFHTQPGREGGHLAYRVNPDSYMVFGYWQKFEHNIFSLQITGYPTQMLPFKGLVLGDPENKVLAALGKPNRTKVVEKSTATLTLWLYDAPANYSVEIDKAGRLYSIRIQVIDKLMELDTKAEARVNHWDRFVKAVASGDKDAVLRLLRPDVEIFKDGDVLSIERRMADFEARPDQPFMDALLEGASSVRARIATAEADMQMRLTEHMGIGSVVKFPKDAVLREIVFFPYDGEYRVFEVAFRGADDPVSKGVETGSTPGK